jgi:hypothetical protein
MALITRKDPTTRLDFDRLERGSLVIEGCVIEGPVDHVVAVLLELMGESRGGRSDD